jgi:hypothetical protein
MHLIKPEAASEGCPALFDLPAERVDRQIFDLVLRGIDSPGARVGVAPLRTDGQRRVREAPRVPPGREECFCQPVRTSGIDIPHPGAVRGIEHRVTAVLHRADGAIAAQVVEPSKIDVPGPPERGKPQPYPRHHETGRTEGMEIQRGSKF